MQGASALQRVLEEHRDAPLRTFVVWERVLVTDWIIPGDSILARITDARAVQFWDRWRLLSPVIRNEARSNPAHEGHNRENDDIIWDIVAIYPKGPKWESSLPPHTFFDGPVVYVAEEFRRALSSSLKMTNDN